jgi:hypothetical protein
VALKIREIPIGWVQRQLASGVPACCWVRARARSLHDRPPTQLSHLPPVCACVVVHPVLLRGGMLLQVCRRARRPGHRHRLQHDKLHTQRELESSRNAACSRAQPARIHRAARAPRVSCAPRQRACCAMRACVYACTHLQATRHAEFEAIDRILAANNGDVPKAAFNRCAVAVAGAWQVRLLSPCVPTAHPAAMPGAVHLTCCVRRLRCHAAPAPLARCRGQGASCT